MELSSESLQLQTVMTIADILCGLMPLGLKSLLKLHVNSHRIAEHLFLSCYETKISLKS